LRGERLFCVPYINLLIRGAKVKGQNYFMKDLGKEKNFMKIEPKGRNVLSYSVEFSEGEGESIQSN
jgi:hypothetical protein